MTVEHLDFVHRFVPAGDERRSMSLVLLHGTGGNEEDLIPVGRVLAPGAALLGVRGKVLEAGMPRFFRRLSEGVFDEEDLVFRTHELARFLEAATHQYALNARGLVAVGYSNGANIAASMLLLEPDTLAAAVLFRPMVPFHPESLPNLQGKRVLILAGSEDPIVPPDHSKRLAALLQGAGAEVTLEWIDTGHGLTRLELNTAKLWLERNTG